MATPMVVIEETKPGEPLKTRAARKTAAKNPHQKKPPQRGLGVAQLERLRLQERWKKMTQISPPHPFLLDFPLQFPVAGASSAPVGNDYGTGVLGFIGNCGFGSGGGGLMTMEPFPHGGGAMVDPRLLIGNSVEASRELSSIPNLPPPPPPPPCVSDRCDICFKKKRVNFSNTMKEKNIIGTAEPPPVSFDFLGLSTNSAATDFDFSLNFNQDGAGVKQIHRKVAGKGGGGGEGSTLMEYEFFPRKNGRGTEFEELKRPNEELGLFAEEEEEEQEEEEEEAVQAVDHGEGSCITTSCSDIINGGTRNSTVLDLSLKLSF
ncbi:protein SPOROCYTELESS [Cucurbita maxima]|uniref:Protein SPOROCYTELESS n=1 Tax=Cucurbita maxima TaxID=3661 RepID=A0A6J1IK53_CUCMA|nr:protein SPOROCYTELESS [Cucurbita maxima]